MMDKKTTRIIGVDFSGAVRERNTWICEGTFDGEVLYICRCHSIPRDELTDKLSQIDEPAVAAMDFPFSVPKEFIDYWGEHDSTVRSAETMPELWRAAVQLSSSNAKLKRWCTKFVNERKRNRVVPAEPVRRVDYYHPGSFSPLHSVHPDMVPMTFRGMQMLHQVWKNSDCRVLPLDCATRQGHLLLMEVMPGLVLTAMGLPHQNYKGKKKAPREIRKYIWRNLESRSGITIKLEEKATIGIESKVICNDDCLDAIVAAIAASLWNLSEDNFHRPPTRSLEETIRKEGWLYTPCPSKLPVNANQ